MKPSHQVQSKMNGKDLCLADSATTHTILRNKSKYYCIRSISVETISEGDNEYLQITSISQGIKIILEKLPAFSIGLLLHKD